MENKIIQRSKSFDWARNILNNPDEDYKTEVLQSLYVKLEEIESAKAKLMKPNTSHLQDMLLGILSKEELINLLKSRTGKLKESQDRLYRSKSRKYLVFNKLL